MKRKFSNLIKDASRRPVFISSVNEICDLLAVEFGYEPQDIFNSIVDAFGKTPREMDKAERGALYATLSQLLLEASCNVPRIRNKLREVYGKPKQA